MKTGETAREIAWTYFGFRGRITRSRFWWSNVGINVVQFVANIMVGLPSLPFASGSDIGEPEPWRAFGALVITLLALYPAAAVMVKRGHDRNRPAWMTLSILFGSFVAAVVASFAWPSGGLLIQIALVAYIVIDLLFLPSNKGENRFGPPPKGRLDETLKPVVLEG